VSEFERRFAPVVLTACRARRRPTQRPTDARSSVTWSRERHANWRHAPLGVTAIISARLDALPYTSGSLSVNGRSATDTDSHGGPGLTSTYGAIGTVQHVATEQYYTENMYVNRVIVFRVGVKCSTVRSLREIDGLVQHQELSSC